jgi:hypothetical protein
MFPQKKRMTPEKSSKLLLDDDDDDEEKTRVKKQRTPSSQDRQDSVMMRLRSGINRKALQPMGLMPYNLRPLLKSWR